MEPQNGGVFTIQRHIKPLPSNEEYGTKTTVKLFLSSTDSTQVEDAIKTGKLCTVLNGETTYALVFSESSLSRPVDPI